ncbi:MAG TPA: hypothetical protein HPP83_09790 [Candidatus Hydrogenedentes bacterium]|nr:hypothetical protein [Candidatus Hydrogenedentota bacterium]
MRINASAPWHRESFERFVKERLPELLAARLPLAAYRIDSEEEHTCTVHISLSAKSGVVEVAYTDIPQPNENGLFTVDGERRVIIPVASEETLDTADILCVGGQLYDFVEARLGAAPPDLPWNESLARSWLPLDTWINEFVRTGTAVDVMGSTSHRVDETNWLAARAHLRKILVPRRETVITASQFGRTCPFETPEGPNIGRILTVANGAEIRDGKLRIVDDSPEAALGLTALMVPFLEHNDANRQLFGVNMMRQWHVPPDPEPALVQTGHEPDAPGFWCGRNLLTAFVSWGLDTFEDAIAISESCAKRLDFPHPVEPGDKLSNRHGTKGTVSRILPDDEMPHLEDGTPVELVFSFLGCHTRLNFGQIREAVMSRIAKAEGAPAIVPPFHAPSEEELRERLEKAGLPESGMEILTLGRAGKKLARPSTVGWVYWGKTFHLAKHKIHADVKGTQMQGELEYYTLRDIAAFENLREHYNTCAAERPDAGSLAERVATGPIEQAGPPTPVFEELARRLCVAGIEARLEEGNLTFRLAPPDGPRTELACPVPHPWLREEELSAIGTWESSDEYGSVVEANAKLEHMIAGQAPDSLTQQALKDLERCVVAFLDTLLTPEQLRFRNQTVFSGRTVISPGHDLRIGELGVPDEIAWTLFGPLVVRETGEAKAVQKRSKNVAKTLDAIMARSWVLITRAPTVMPTSILAFRPVRCPDRVIRLHPLATILMNADFDGDQAAVFLPLTEAAQREAGQRLTIAAHLERDPTLIRFLRPLMEMLWGLADLSLAPEGRDEIASLAGIELAAHSGLTDRDAFVDAMRAIRERDGIEEVLETLERLMRRGFELAKASGASLSPFVGSGLELPQEPAGKDPDDWSAHAEAVADCIASRHDFDSADLGPQLLSVKSGARGNLCFLLNLIGPRGVVADANGEPTIVRHGFVQGLTPDEAFACAAGAREGLAQTAIECTRQYYGVREVSEPKGFNVLARAMRAERPGIVFARAAASGEVDPLTDLDSRIFVGLPAPSRERA